MSSPVPQNADEAAYIGFAIVDALADVLLRCVITRVDFQGALLASIQQLDLTPNKSYVRAADFIRVHLLR